MVQFRYSYDALVYYGEDISKSIDRVARFGYDAIELVGEPAELDGDRIRKLADDAGIAVSSISSVYTAERDLAHPDQEVRKKAVQYVRDLADLAAASGAQTIIIAPTAVMKTQPLAPRDDERRWAIEGMREGGEYAASVGVNLTLECWNRYETYWLNRLEQAVELWNEVGLSNGGVMGDTFHMNLEESSIPDAFRQTGSLLNHVHLADTNRAAPGQGHMDFAAILQALADIDYQGYLSFELLPAAADPFGVMRAGGAGDFFDKYTEQSIKHLKQLEPQVQGG